MTNDKYVVRPEVMSQIKFTPRDNRLAKVSGLIQGILTTPPEQWNDTQAIKAKHFKLQKISVEQLRWLMDNETDG